MKKLSATRTSLIIIATAIIAFAGSCSKSSSGPTNSNFTGTYAGTLKYSAYSEADTITIPASSSSTIVMNTKTGVGSTYSMNGTVSGSNVTIASQSIVSLGTTYTVTGNGTLTGSTLVINYLFVSPTKVTYNWTFSGTKQ